jgi:ribosomal protein L40E
MGRPRKSVRPQSFSVDKKLLGFIEELADKNNYTMSHVVNMALSEYKPIKDLDIYRDYWKCDQRDCQALNPPTEEKCTECGWKALWVIEKEHNEMILKYK